MGRKIRTRRGVLALTGGTLVGLAGCSGGTSDDSDDSGADDSDNGNSSDDDILESLTETWDVPRRGYYQYSIKPDNEVTFEWSVQNELDSWADFDVFLFSRSEFEIYVDMIEGDSKQPEYISGGTAEGIEQSASRTVTLNSGNYRLVVDNSDYGDAGDSGQEGRVTMTMEVREA